MGKVSSWIVGHHRAAWIIFLALAAAIALSLMMGVQRYEQNARRLRLGVEAERSGIEIMSLTLNGSLMGSTSVLGLIDADVKADLGSSPAINSPKISHTLESITRFHNAQGVFIVGADGIVRSSWDSSGKPSTALNVSFRPYFKMAMQGTDNVYAAVSLARGDRGLYFASPAYSGQARTGTPIGVVVARSDAIKLDRLLENRADIVFLLSPQGVVFASTKPEWLGHLAAEPTPERIEAIRQLKQFGAMFENKVPPKLPFEVGPKRIQLDKHTYAMASSSVSWNDPSGNWQVVLLEDLSASTPWVRFIWVGATCFILLLIIGSLGLKLMRGRFAQINAAAELARYADSQRQAIAFKTHIADTARAMQQSQSIAEVAQCFFRHARDQLGALQGVLYCMDPGQPGRLRLAAGYACSDTPPERLDIGEGLLGQCAHDRRLRIETRFDDSGWSIRSGLGDSLPAAALMAPLIFNDHLLGVVEAAVLAPPNEQQSDHFQELAALLALNLETKLTTHEWGETR